MRFKVSLQVDKKAFGNYLPINYQPFFMGVIYKLLSSADREYGEWLHENGYRLDRKQFKLFTYSPLFIPALRFDRERNCLEIRSDQADWYLSFLPERSTRHFIRGVFREQVFQLGDSRNVVQFRVESIEKLLDICWGNEAEFETMSPVCITRREADWRVSYLPPTDPFAVESLLYSLQNRYRAYTGESCPVEPGAFGLEVLSEPVSKLITFKAGTPQESKIKGYHFRFRLKAPAPLMKIAYETGLGVKGSQGFGMIELKAL